MPVLWKSSFSIVALQREGWNPRPAAADWAGHSAGNRTLRLCSEVVLPDSLTSLCSVLMLIPGRDYAACLSGQTKEIAAGHADTHTLDKAGMCARVC